MPATKVTGPPIILIRVAPALREARERRQHSVARSSAESRHLDRDHPARTAERPALTRAKLGTPVTARYLRDRHVELGEIRA
jgi:hypothetical protein